MLDVDAAVAGNLRIHQDAGTRQAAVGRDGKAMRILFRSGLAAGLVGAAVLFVIAVGDDAGDRGAAGPSFLGVGEQADAPPANQQAARDRRQGPGRTA